MSINALVLNGSDTVATVVKPLNSGENISVTIENAEISITLRQPIPLGHKYALKDIKHGERIIKYGETIGVATMPIQKGEHVHVHNVEGLPGEGEQGLNFTGFRRKNGSMERGIMCCCLQPLSTRLGHGEFALPSPGLSV